MSRRPGKLSIKQDVRFGKPGDFRAAMRVFKPELAAQLDAMEARDKAALEKMQAEALEVFGPDEKVKLRRTCDPSRKDVTEAEVVAEIKAACRARGWRTEVMRNGGVEVERGGRDIHFQMGEHGRADLYVYPAPHLVAFVEVKRPHGGVVSLAQEAWHARRASAGYATGFASSAAEAVAIVERCLAEARAYWTALLSRDASGATR